VCAVVVEKPFTPTHAEAEELIVLAKKHGRILTVYQSKWLGLLYLDQRTIQLFSTVLCCGC